MFLLFIPNKSYSGGDPALDNVIDTKSDVSTTGNGAVITDYMLAR